MKKTLSIIALSVIGLGLVSCKKEENKTAENSDVVGIDSTNAPSQDSAAAFANPASAGTEANVPKSTEPITTIALSESNFDFGNVKKGSKVNHVYEVTNTGKNPLIISQVKPGCGCTVPEFTKEPIMPGKKGKITLSFNSSNFDGSVQKFADVFANVENVPVKLTFSANVTP